MTPRTNPFASAPSLMQSFIDFGNAVVEQGLEPGLMELVKIRSSQINGCAICLRMHTQAARSGGESEERIYMLDAWRNSALYSPRERAALAWTDALTRLSETHAPDEAYEAMHAEFSEEEQAKLTLLIVVINGFNRIGVGFRVNPAMAAARRAA